MPVGLFLGVLGGGAVQPVPAHAWRAGAAGKGSVARRSDAAALCFATYFAIFYYSIFMLLIIKMKIRHFKCITVTFYICGLLLFCFVFYLTVPSITG
jgi:hypothetical protein